MKHRIKESELRNMIRECIEDALYEGKVKDTLNKAVKYGKKQLNKFNQSIKDLTDEYDEDGNPIVDNPMYKGKKSNNESRLRGMIREAVRSALNENGDIYDNIDSKLSQIGDDVYVSRFYSDENQITIAAHKNIGREGRKEVINIMKEFGYDLYTTGGNDDFIMMTFN